MSRAHDAVTARMAKKVDASKLYLSTADDLHEKLTLELASELERAKDRDYVSVSWTSQVEATAYFNKHGFVDTLNHMLELRKKNNS